MLRAVVLAARLQFSIDQPVLDAIAIHRTRSRAARQRGWSRSTTRSCDPATREDAFKQLRATGLLKAITPELAAAADPLWQSIAALDRYRARFEAAPDSLTNAILAGTLLHPLGLVARRRFSADALERRIELGMLPIARRDIERLQQILALQPRLLDLQAPAARPARAAPPRRAAEAITWLEIHGEPPRRRRPLASAPGRTHDRTPRADDTRRASAPAPRAATAAAPAPPSTVRRAS